MRNIWIKSKEFMGLTMMSYSKKISILIRVGLSSLRIRIIPMMSNTDLV